MHRPISKFSPTGFKLLTNVLSIHSCLWIAYSVLVSIWLTLFCQVNKVQEAKVLRRPRYSKNSKRNQRNSKDPKESKRIQKYRKDSKRIQKITQDSKIPKDFKRIQNIPKGSKRFLKIPKYSKRIQEIQKILKNPKIFKKFQKRSSQWQKKLRSCPVPHLEESKN